MIRLWLILLLMLSVPAWAAPQTGARDGLEAVPVLHDGRLKPLSVMAGITLQRISGEKQLDGMTPMDWLYETMFMPRRSAGRPLFPVKEASLRRSFGLPEREGNRYSAAELAPPLTAQRKAVMAIVQMPASERSAEQQELIDLFEKLILYHDLQHSFSLILPLDAPLPPSYGLPPEASYLDLYRIRETVRADAKALAKQSHGDLFALTPEQRETVALAYTLDRLEQQSGVSRSLRIMPGWASASGEWFTPWQLIRDGQGSPASAAYLRQWGELLHAYRSDNAEAWRQASQRLAAEAMRPLSAVAQYRLRMELLYHRLSPVQLATFAAALALLLAAGGRRRPSLAAMVQPVLASAALLTAGGLGLRIFILARPPVGTLYESLLFVACVLLVVGLLFARRHPAVPLVASASATLLLAIAPSFAGEESMGMLSAVLNTDLWLIVHVLCITAGYAACLLAGGLAHWQLFAGTASLRGLLLACFAALLLTATGTLLGGVWADQSWGRFWGWDPKENGALLIVLWLLWTLHGRLGGLLSPTGFTACVAAVNIFVALAWFGVNMLGIGLHSYGFTDAAAYGLAVFCLGEGGLIYALYRRARRLEAIACPA